MIPRTHACAERNPNAAGLEVPEQHIGICAAQQYMIAGHVLEIHTRWMHVRQAVERCDHYAGTWRDHFGTVNKIGVRF